MVSSSRSVRTTRKPSEPSSALHNHEVVTLAVYALGGETREVDTEDAAVRANELAPGRFTWRKYPDQINIELIRAFLSDAKKSSRGGYLAGSGTTGWLLTEAGVRFSKENLPRVQSGAGSAARLTASEKRRRDHDYARLSASEAFAKFSAGRATEITREEAEALLRLNPYIVGRPRELKIQRFVNAFGHDAALGEAVRHVATIARQEPAR